MNESRRDFVKKIATITFASSITPSILANTANNASLKKDPLRLGIIGCLNRGFYNMKSFRNLGQKITAICDVDSSKSTLNVINNYHCPSGENLITDYRKFLEKKHTDFDALVISTPDVSHFAITKLALEYGLPVYLEKPMCHSIGQIRTLMNMAKEKNIVTQMGNQSHSALGIHYCNEWIKNGFIGKVREAVIWTNRPCDGPGMAILKDLRALNGLPNEIPVPDTLNWDAWQSTATPDAYRPEIHLRNWRCWWKYGSGALGDIGCHIMDIPTFCLDLPMPSVVKSRQTGTTPYYCPQQDVVEYYFDNTNQGVPFKLSWHSGVLPDSKNAKFKGYEKDFRPILPDEFVKAKRSVNDLSTDGLFLIGDEGVIYSPTMHLAGTPVLLPKEKYSDLKSSGKLPEVTSPFGNGNHYVNFIKAVKGEEKAGSDFQYGGKLTEIVQLGNLSLKTNSNIVWDSENMICKDNKQATELVNEPMRKDWY